MTFLFQLSTLVQSTTSETHRWVISLAHTLAHTHARTHVHTRKHTQVLFHLLCYTYTTHALSLSLHSFLIWRVFPSLSLPTLIPSLTHYRTTPLSLLPPPTFRAGVPPTSMWADKLEFWGWKRRWGSLLTNSESAFFLWSSRNREKVSKSYHIVKKCRASVN